MTERLALTSAQTGVWVAQQLNPGDTSFTCTEYCDIAGPVDPDRFRAALCEVVAATPALRAGFDLGDEGLVQHIDDTVDIPMHYLDLSRESDAYAAARCWMARHRENHGFDLTKGPLATWALFKAASDRFIWYRAVHHIAVDGLGHSLIASAVADSYTALSTGRRRRTAPVGTLRQVVEADIAYQRSDAFRRDGEFWAAYLENRMDTVSLTDWRLPPNGAAIRESAYLEPAEVGMLRSVARDLVLPWPAVVVAVLAVQLHRATGVRRMTLSLPVTARTEPALRTVPAMVSNTVPLRLDLTAKADFKTVAEQAAEGLKEVLRHQRYPMERLARLVPGLPAGRRQFGPEINIMSFHYDDDYAGSRATVHSLNSGPVEDLTINIYHRGWSQGMHIAFDGNSALYGRAELSHHVEEFASLLRSVRGLLDGGLITS
ncbi:MULTISPECIES: condensation domain-containing protein [Streptomyces]|uniref:Condensation domain-containing protein n=1 Tax=Streptomyces yunnanensis TaxID=156453 RepID=A0ABY8AFI9_9ACTN|nr:MULTISPECIES: condensation domain-containing protein [Streptomyces]AJC59851.1 amino acid adenylation protein [Streptomyces sp. 769]WEB43760.1 condensation domain-containing protein [Streptomyces yunnanensis]